MADKQTQQEVDKRVDKLAEYLSRMKEDDSIRFMMAIIVLLSARWGYSEYRRVLEETYMNAPYRGEIQ